LGVGVDCQGIAALESDDNGVSYIELDWASSDAMELDIETDADGDDGVEGGSKLTVNTSGLSGLGSSASGLSLSSLSESSQ
jgi:hypothetical protein